MYPATVTVSGWPATFATASESAWRQAVSAACVEAGLRPPDDECNLGVAIDFVTPTPKNDNERWDLDNLALVKPTLDAMRSVFGERVWKHSPGVPQPNDDRVVILHATKRTVEPGEEPGAVIKVWLVP